LSQIRTRILVGPDHRITGSVPANVPPGEYDAEIAIGPQADAAPLSAEAEIQARIWALQEEVARLPILDPRAPDEILGYGKDGLFE
jgi:hypothetical protein